MPFGIPPSPEDMQADLADGLEANISDLGQFAAGIGTSITTGGRENAKDLRTAFAKTQRRLDAGISGNAADLGTMANSISLGLVVGAQANAADIGRAALPMPAGLPDGPGTGGGDPGHCIDEIGQPPCVPPILPPPIDDCGCPGYFCVWHQSAHTAGGQILPVGQALPGPVWSLLGCYPSFAEAQHALQVWTASGIVSHPSVPCTPRADCWTPPPPPPPDPCPNYCVVEIPPEIPGGCLPDPSGAVVCVVTPSMRPGRQDGAPKLNYGVYLCTDHLAFEYPVIARVCNVSWANWIWLQLMAGLPYNNPPKDLTICPVCNPPPPPDHCPECKCDPCICKPPPPNGNGK